MLLQKLFYKRVFGELRQTLNLHSMPFSFEKYGNWNLRFRLKDVKAYDLIFLVKTKNMRSVNRKNFTYSYMILFQVRNTYTTVDCPLSKGNQAAAPKIERPNGKTQNPKKILNRSRIGADSSLESSMKQFLWIFESNQNKWNFDLYFNTEQSTYAEVVWFKQVMII